MHRCRRQRDRSQRAGHGPRRRHALQGAAPTSALTKAPPAPRSTGRASTSPAPSGGQSYAAPASITITANATAASGTIANVAFYENGTQIGQSAGPTYSFTWNNVAAGTYTLTAVATDSNNLSTTSAGITVTVTAAAGPTVVINTPINNAIYDQGATISLSATPTDATGTVTGVSFYQGTTKIGDGANSFGVWSFTWTNVAAGTYALTSVATEGTGRGTSTV